MPRDPLADQRKGIRELADIAGMKAIESPQLGVVPPVDPNKLEVKAVWSAMDDVDVTAIEWLWEQRIPLALSVFLGDPDMGKSLVTLDLAARVSTGRDFPDAPNRNPPSRVLLMIAEDTISDTVKPRLIAAGADLNYIEYLNRIEIRQGARKEEREFALDADLKHLEEKLRSSPTVRLVICDTISSYLGKTEMGKEQPMRKVLLPIRKLCEEARVAFSGVAHFNKRSDVSMIHRASGAVAIVGVPRAAWVFGANKDVPGDFYMLRIKNNLSRVRTGLSYTIAEKKIGKDLHGVDVTAPYIVWRDHAVTGEANDLLASEGVEERKQAKATKFLLDSLADGARSADSVAEQGSARGIGRTNLFAAKKAAGIHAYKLGSTWWWSLEPKSSSSVQKQ